MLAPSVLTGQLREPTFSYGSTNVNTLELKPSVTILPNNFSGMAGVEQGSRYGGSNPKSFFFSTASMYLSWATDQT